MIYSIAIDGPAGAGKSTIARDLAKRLGFTYVDTGAMYRAIALWVMDKGICADDEKSIEKQINEIEIKISYENGAQQIFVNGSDVTDQLRREDVGKTASLVSKVCCVREKLVDLQREIAKGQSVIMDGRDVGTKVLPKAFLKIFMTAAPEVRAKRRFEELRSKGEGCSFEDILNNIKMRDHADENRDISPLKMAEDAIMLDTSELTASEVAENIMKLFLEKTQK